jgi:hypothetical protein
LIEPFFGVCYELLPVNGAGLVGRPAYRMFATGSLLA